MKRIATIISVMAVLAALAVPGTALAQGSSTCQAYNSLCDVSSFTQNSEPPSASTSSSSLPFTGLDLGLLVVGGGVLLGSGLVVRRVSRRLN